VSSTLNSGRLPPLAWIVTSSPGPLDKIAIVVGIRSKDLVVVTGLRRDMEKEYKRWKRAEVGFVQVSR